jgi:methylmalonyl-CoA/ethylmalonyl-CoA epimerase
MRRLEHVGLAVAEVDQALRICKLVLMREPYKQEEVIADGVRTVFLEAGAVKLELLESLSDESPVGRFLARRGEGVHHLAFEVDHLDAEISRLQTLGFAIVGEPRLGADGKRIVFLHPKDTMGVLVELCQQVSFPATEPSERPALLVAPGKAGDPLAHSLARHASIFRSPEQGIAGAAAVDPAPDWVRRLPPDLPVVLVGETAGQGSRGRGLTIGIDSPGDVVFPGHLLTRLPDPWGVIADLTAAHILG